MPEQMSSLLFTSLIWLLYRGSGWQVMLGKPNVPNLLVGNLEFRNLETTTTDAYVLL